MPENGIEKTFRKGQEASDQFAALINPNGPPMERSPNRIQEQFDVAQQTAEDMAGIVIGKATPSKKEEK